MVDMETEGGVSRRTLLVAGSGAALGVTVLTACGGGGTSDPSPAAPRGGSTSAGGGAGNALAKVADIPVGGAVSATGPDGKPVIVSQPSPGEVAAFSAICTHQGCTVAPQGKILKCPCHGSTYDLATGDNTGGPAPKPLPRIAVRVKDGNVVQA